MKKWLLSMVGMYAMTWTTSACTPTNDLADTANPVPDLELEPAPDQQPNREHCLIVYFTCTGTTGSIAGQIAEIAGGDTWQIRPAVPYTETDLDYNTDCRANREQNDPSARPSINGKIENMSDYDLIYLGYPIWWGKAPKIISTFLESYDFSGKVIVPFCTSHSSGIGSSDTDLHRLASQAVWKQGKRFSASSTQEEIAHWIKNIDSDNG